MTGKANVHAYAGFSEALFTLLRNKLVEVYLGTTSEERQYSDYSITRKEVIRGVIKEVHGDLVVLEVKVPKSGVTNLVYLNCWGITSVLEPVQGACTMDVYCDEAGKERK